MIEFLWNLLKAVLAYAPFAFFIWLDAKANVKREERSTQVLMPVIALVYCVVLMLLSDKIGEKLIELIRALPQFLEGVPLLSTLAPAVEKILDILHIELLLFYLFNVLLLVVHIILKKICLPLLKKLCKKAYEFVDAARGLFYEQDPISGVWLLKKNFAQGRTFLKTLFLGGTAISMIVARIAVGQYIKHEMSALLYPAFGVILLGEFFFFVDGLAPDEYAEELQCEEGRAQRFCNYVPLRNVLRKLFPDKIAAENTTMGTSFAEASEEGSGLFGKMKTGDGVADAYYEYMHRQQLAGRTIDPGYLASGLNLTKGTSVLFNDPFYYDLVPYAFYAMNRDLLRHKKILVILGRHGIEKDITTWLDFGLTEVTNIPEMWRIGVLTDKEQDLDIGIVTRSGVHQLDMHTQNEEFFLHVGMVILIEPSRLITTAQIGLNSIIRRCKSKGVTFCSTDKNCDGLVDALSHLLMTNITEVSATNRHEGTCSYMCWEPDGENMQHRLLPNISRYLGVGTELSFVALKNQVENATWYGGEAFPVEDIRWIAKQYYYDLLHYANLPTNQEQMDRSFTVSHNIWNQAVRENGYFVVEDESCNMFEIKREFATRATNQSFINIISPQYLLHDYMAANNEMFNTDPKAIPSIVADYARTSRNVVLRLFLRMSLGDITKRELAAELRLIGISEGDPVEQVWDLLGVMGKIFLEEDNRRKCCIRSGGKNLQFACDEVIETVRRYSLRTGEVDDFVRITDRNFKDLILSDLSNARYISEEENGSRNYIGSELIGHIFQKYLPGQFFTFEGKYYEMIRITQEDEVMLRRAADHISGRNEYRQIRQYTIGNVEDSTEIGAQRSINNMRLTHQFADISVATPGYWQLESYQDFAGGRKIELNGIPRRSYVRKQILRVDFNADGGRLDSKICQTLTLLINEAFRTLFAENSAYIAAVCAGDCTEPLTYSLQGDGTYEPLPGSIYFIEDSQLDLGLLVAVERNLDRIFEILCDYLQWHFEELENSKKAPPPAPIIDFNEPQEDEAETETVPAEKKESLWGKIKGRFRKLLPKKKADKPQTEEPAEEQTEEQTEVPQAEELQNAEETAAEEADSADVQPDSAEEVPAEDEPIEPIEPTEVGEGQSDESEESEMLISFSIDAPSLHVPVPEAEESAESTEEPTEDAAEEPTEEPTEEKSEVSEESDVPETVEFEAPQFAMEQLIPPRKPYYERCYLYYGGKEIPKCLDIEGTLELLKTFGFDGRELSQARHGKDVAAQIEEHYIPNLPGVRYCDFCGAELTGTEWDVLRDGRESCVNCSKSAIRSEEEMRRIYHELLKNLEVFFGMYINVPVKIQMVNAERLHKKIGLSFVPSALPDSRVLGVAIRDKKGNYSILVENGAPRVRSAMTMAHELTHIWQYTNWDMAAIRQKYGAHEKEVYEGMAKWCEIQYAFLIGEAGIAKREEITTTLREDEYGRGFLKYAKKYPISPYTHIDGATPFDNRTEPL